MGDSRSSSQDLCVLFAWGYAWLHPLKAVAFVRATFVVCRVPCALSPLLSPSLSHRSVVCRLPSPMAAGLSTVSDRQRRCCHVVQREQITFRFPFSTCHLPLAARHHTVLRSPAASCHMPQGTLRGRMPLCKCLSPLESLEIRPGKCAQAQK